ncbi:HAD family hydrolase [Natronogracilivirga saccharolytica]|uniref:HAD family phosphatase n=1 Tax=Natronogracilivirga saccharolytica TaxID=2812953 RepID=A0A8J7UUA6_9BACT|nr:HAD family phosphatase [Natronogracilivirga saccharolytica]MBP3191266.1 HAD family phosphatase [Natronogracilivirga saccharolytica]
MNNSGFGILFDMDGVIADSNPVHRQAIHTFCQNHGKELTDAFFRQHISGRTNKEWIPKMFTGISKEEAQILADEKERLFRSMFSPEEHLLPGLLAFIDEISRAEIPVAVATSAPAENADFILSRAGIAGYFNAVLNSSHVSKGKPDPDIYLKSAEVIGVPPSGCVVIEDSLPGIEAGKRAGASVIGVTTTHRRDELLACDKVIDDFQDLNLKIIDDLVKSGKSQSRNQDAV